MSNFKINIFYLFISSLIISCDSQMVYEEYEDYDNEVWNIDSLATFHFEIEDPSESFNLITYIRNTNGYPFQNIYVKYSLIKEDSINGSDTLLADTMKDLQLFELKTGEPFGKVENSVGNSSTGAIYTHPFFIKEGFSFPQKGEYTFQVKHFMRSDDLNGIIGVGYRLEKAE